MNETFDRLNVLSFPEYFGEMEITEEQKKKRVALADELLDLLLFLFAYARRLLGGTEDADKSRISAVLADEFAVGYRRIIPLQDAYLARHVALVAAGIAAATLKDTAYAKSYERAFYTAANEANTVVNYQEYAQAVADGKTKKTWRTMKDERVRRTHWRLDDQTIAIGEYFHVGESWMRFPHDEQLGADASEIIGCRCSVDYSS